MIWLYILMYLFLLKVLFPFRLLRNIELQSRSLCVICLKYDSIFSPKLSNYPSPHTFSTGYHKFML